jgi:transposase
VNGIALPHQDAARRADTLEELADSYNRSIATMHRVTSAGRMTGSAAAMRKGTPRPPYPLST